jgi:hypothetical protein
MKFSVLSAGALLASLAAAAPTKTVNRVVARANGTTGAAITDAADTGYATQNGGYVNNTCYSIEDLLTFPS